MDEIFATINKNRLRTLLTAFGVFWGIFMIVVMLGIGNGLQNGVMKEFSGMSANAMWMWGSQTTLPFAGMQPGRSIQLKEADIEYIRNHVEGVKYVVAQNSVGGYRGSTIVRHKDKSSSFAVYGSDHEVNKIELIQLREGRFLNENDDRDRKKIVVIGERVKELLFSPSESPIGQSIEINGIYFLVVGTFGTNRTDERASDDLKKCYIPFSTYQQAFNNGDKVSWISVLAKDEYDISAMQQEIKKALAPRLKFDPNDRQAIGGWNGKAEFDKINGLFVGIKIFVWIVGFFTLIAGIVGISNIMLIVVKERTLEIGIRKAIGARPLSILIMILLETLFLTLVSGIVGIAAGVAFTENFEPIVMGLSKISGIDFELNMFTNPGIDLKVALQAMFILLFFGMLAGLVPSAHAVKIRPVEAIRNE